MDQNENQEMIYIIKINDHLKDKWAEWLNGAAVKIENHNHVKATTITVRIPDQAALRGILNKLWDLNLTLLSVILMDKTIIGDKNESEIYLNFG